MCRLLAKPFTLTSINNYKWQNKNQLAILAYKYYEKPKDLIHKWIHTNYMQSFQNSIIINPLGFSLASSTVYSHISQQWLYATV